MRPVLRAHFHLARLYGRIDIFGTGTQQLEPVKKSLATYEWLRDFALREIHKFHGEDLSIFASELTVIDDMIRILPEKINRMHSGGQTYTR